MRAASTVSYHFAISSNWPVRSTKWANLAGWIGWVAGASRRIGAISFIAGLPSRVEAGAQPTPRRPLSRDAVVARPGKFDQVEAVAERVGQVRHATVFALLDAAVEGRAQPGQPRHGGIDVRHDEIEMHRRPMALEAALHLGAAQRRGERAVA